MFGVAVIFCSRSWVVYTRCIANVVLRELRPKVRRDWIRALWIGDYRGRGDEVGQGDCSRVSDDRRACASGIDLWCWDRNGGLKWGL